MKRLAIALLALAGWSQTLLGQDDVKLSTPRWLREYKFDPAEFTFVRIQYDDAASVRRGRAGSWATDYPDADMALSKHLAAATSLRVDPKGKVLRLTDDRLSRHRFIYIGEPGRMRLSDEEVKSLRRYLLDGGFLMLDDFWGEEEWKNVRHELKRVFPDRKPERLPLEHPIFHCVYDLKEQPQVPSIAVYYSGGIAERLGAMRANYLAIRDDDKRIMAIICHNTDLADGWERLSEGGEYAKEVSVKKAIPMGVNIVIYALTQKIWKMSR